MSADACVFCIRWTWKPELGGLVSLQKAIMIIYKVCESSPDLSIHSKVQLPFFSHESNHPECFLYEPTTLVNPSNCVSEEIMWTALVSPLKGCPSPRPGSVLRAISYHICRSSWPLGVFHDPFVSGQSRAKRSRPVDE